MSAKIKVDWEDLKHITHSEVPRHLYLAFSDDHLDQELLELIGNILNPCVYTQCVDILHWDAMQGFWKTHTTVTGSHSHSYRSQHLKNC